MSTTDTKDDSPRKGTGAHIASLLVQWDKEIDTTQLVDRDELFADLNEERETDETKTI
jgi:hypothetical protein